MEYKYFTSYWIQTKDNSSIPISPSNAFIFRSRPIETEEDVREIEDQIKEEQDLRWIVISSFQLIGTTEKTITESNTIEEPKEKSVAKKSGRLY